MRISGALSDRAEINAKGAPVGHIERVEPRAQIVSPLTLCDRLISLAQDAERAGYVVAAEHLLYLASSVLDAPGELCA